MSLRRCYSNLTFKLNYQTEMDRLKQIFIDEEKKARNKAMIDYFADKNRSLEEKLRGLVPFTHFIMAFRDLMNVIKQERNDTDLQKLINIHSDEDSGHWIWYLNDVIKLNTKKKFGKNPKKLLKEVWDDDYSAVRDFSYTIFRYYYEHPNPSFILLMIETLEISYVALADAIKTAVIDAGRYEDLEFFGKTHYDAEAGHEIHNEDKDELWEQIIGPLSKKELRKAELMVKDLFEKSHAMHKALIS